MDHDGCSASQGQCQKKLNQLTTIIIMIIKSKVRHLIAAGTMLLIGAASASAQTSPYYINGEVGASFLQDVTIRNTGGAKATFNPGVRGGFALGYNLSD